MPKITKTRKVIQLTNTDFDQLPSIISWRIYEVPAQARRVIDMWDIDGCLNDAMRYRWGGSKWL
jgi:hypothetical protein